MSTELKLRRGTSLQHSTFIGQNGEVTYNTTTKELHAHDGITIGGNPVLNRNKLAEVMSSVLISGKAASEYRVMLDNQTQFYAVEYGLLESNNGLQNCLALQALSAAIKANGGGKAVFPSGTFRIGAQNFAGQTGLGYAYEGVPMFDVRDLPYGSVHLDFHSTKFEFEDGLKFGAFNPVTGAALVNSNPNFVTDTQAYTGYVFLTVNVSDVLVTGKCTIDGRDTTRIIGGFYGDLGRQCPEYGFNFQTYRRLKIEGQIYCHHLCLDGIYTRAVGIDDDIFTAIDGYVGLFNARQAWSCCGGSNNFISNSILGYTGYGVIDSSPGSGIDIEPEGVPVRGFKAVNCWLPRSKGPCYVSDNFNVTDVSFDHCEFENTSFSSIWSVLKGIKFSYCTFAGAVYNVREGTATGQKGGRPKFYECDFLDTCRDGTFARRFAGTGGNGGILFNSVNADFENCRMWATISTTYPVIGIMDGSNLKGVTLNIYGNWEDMVGYESFYCRNSDYIIDFTINNLGEGRQPSTTVSSVTLDGAKKIRNATIKSNAGNSNSLVWENPLLVNTVTDGPRKNEDSENPQAEVFLGLWKSGTVPSIGFDGYQAIKSYGSVPSDGTTWQRGWLALNNTPSAGGVPAWLCTTAGVAGSTAVFKPFGNLGD